MRARARARTHTHTHSSVSQSAVTEMKTRRDDPPNTHGKHHPTEHKHRGVALRTEIGSGGGGTSAKTPAVHVRNVQRESRTTAGLGALPAFLTVSPSSHGPSMPQPCSDTLQHP
jgi:hypothetical protein